MFDTKAFVAKVAEKNSNEPESIQAVTVVAE